MPPSLSPRAPVSEATLETLRQAGWTAHDIAFFSAFFEAEGEGAGA